MPPPLPPPPPPLPPPPPPSLPLLLPPPLLPPSQLWNMQGFVVVGFAIVAVGLALNKLWDSLFWWLNFEFWDLQLLNLH
jgi:hypothetical protein